MAYMSNRFKESKFDELHAHLIRLEGCESRVRTARKELGLVVAELRDLKEIEATIMREIRTGRPDDEVERDQPLIAHAERNGHDPIASRPDSTPATNGVPVGSPPPPPLKGRRRAAAH